MPLDVSVTRGRRAIPVLACMLAGLLFAAPRAMAQAGAGAGGMQASRAQDLLNGFGINTHLDGCCNGPGGDYTNTDAVIRAIRYIGHVSLLRDFCQSGKLLDIAPRVATATGARFWCAIGESRPADFPVELSLMRRGRQDPSGWIVAYEGPNEPDSPYSRSLGGPFLRQAAAFMPTLYHAAREDGVTAVQTSFGVVYPRSNYGTTGDLAAYADLGNAHIYPQACPNCLGLHGTGAIDWMNREARKTTPGKPVAITEWGYTTPARAAYGAVSEAAQAAYVLEFILDAHALGNPVYIYYGLLNDVAGTFGLFHNDFTPKPAAAALRDFLALLHDPSPEATRFPPGRLALHLRGMPPAERNAGGRSALFQKADGSFWLALWNEQPLNDYASDNHDVAVPPVPVTVVLDRPAASFRLYDPVRNGTVPVTAGQGGTISLRVPARPVLLRIDP